MIVSSRLAKSSAVSLALLAHGAVALTLASPEDPRTEGASGGAEVRLGSSFADMAAGRVRPEPAKTPAEKADPEKLTPDRVKAHAEQAKPDQISPERPRDAAEMAQKPRSAVQAPEPVARRLAAVDPAQTDTGPRLDSLKPDPPETQDLAALAPAPERVTPERAAPAPAIKPVAPDNAPAERVTGEAPKSAAVSRSLRPKMRTPEFEAANKPVAKPKAKPRAKPAPQGGGAARNARAGNPTGNDAAKARNSGNNGRKAAPGNAAASNYPGLVMRKLSRAGRPRVNARGTAVVAFSISSGGGLASLSLARSSGSSALDRAALGVVRSAAPFPQPPNGARRSFSIQIQGR
ncbi:MULTISPECIES: cell envelope integrity protein TolA [Mameliella]|uniref:cell envelope integrity protein TolA n=1 Tax=Mameliella TaxID=1434019 RepID=UPI000B53675B|nr:MULTISPECIES: TonB family protein [Mameliella]MCR9272578.1 TonB family protein [Paracoccaceae bacterium]OWV60360.1 energy transducer TonB [Mameliella alba]